MPCSCIRCKCTHVRTPCAVGATRRQVSELATGQGQPLASVRFLSVPFLPPIDSSSAEPWLVDQADSYAADTKMSVNGFGVQPEFTKRVWNGSTYGLMTIRDLTQYFPTLPSGGLRLCVEVSYPSAGCAGPEDPRCPMPRNVCYGSSCVYSLSNVDRSCCPVFKVAKS